MGSAGQSSVQITFKVNSVLREKIDREREYTGGTLSEFINDAVKHYIDHLEQKRIDEARYAASKKRCSFDTPGLHVIRCELLMKKGPEPLEEFQQPLTLSSAVWSTLLEHSASHLLQAVPPHLSDSILAL